MCCIFKAVNVPVINFIFCLIILLLGIVKAKKSRPALLIGLAFGLFMVTHLSSVLRIPSMSMASFVAIRILAYFVIIWAMTKLA